MPSGLDGRVVLITGGGSGIGRATALRVAREGAKVMIGDYVPEGALKTVAMVKEAGGTADCIAADVSVPRQVEAMVGKTVAIFGRLDCAFNNAGIAGPGGGAYRQLCGRSLWPGHRNQPERGLALYEVRDPADA